MGRTRVGAALPRACHGESVRESINALGCTEGLGAGRILLSSVEEAFSVPIMSAWMHCRAWIPHGHTGFTESCFSEFSAAKLLQTGLLVVFV